MSAFIVFVLSFVGEYLATDRSSSKGSYEMCTNKIPKTENGRH